MTDELFYQIALTMINGVGGILSRQLLSAFGNAESVFKEKRQVLERVPGIGTMLANEIKKQEVLEKAEAEIAFIEKANIKPMMIADPDYPKRLAECPDAPLVLYYKGCANLNTEHVVSVVGTRHITRYGQELTADFVEQLSELFPDTLIVSGLAYGVDVMAHKTALRYNMPTVGILAHGLDRIYPALHRQTALDMLNNGGLLTDFHSKTEPDRPNFLKRNHIIAGMSDATVVVESAAKGGSLVTAGMAFSYNRDVFAFPGRVSDNYSAGCNNLIREKKAEIITSASDLVEAMGWNRVKERQTDRQRELFTDDSPETCKVIKCLSEMKEAHIDTIAKQTEISVRQLSNILFELEMAGRLRAIPGNMYRLL